MELLAHRGLWHHDDEKNSLEAFAAAFRQGYGVELDVRDEGGALVVSHDPPDPAQPRLLLEQVFDCHASIAPRTWIAINIKADGLAPGLQSLFLRFPQAKVHSFAFDMSVPELIKYSKTDIRAFSRHSDYEPQPNLLDRALGLWMDCFDIPAVDLRDINKFLSLGKAVAIVSPELHGRPHLEFWQALKDEIESRALNLNDPDRIMLCTDFPHDAEMFFEESMASGKQ